MTQPIHVEGLDELMQQLQAHPLFGAQLREALNKSGMIIQREARRRAPVDRGRLRSSITYKMEPGSFPLGVIIGTGLSAGGGVHYTPYMEYGTGLVHDHPSWPRQRHVVPASALAGWAGRHGTTGGAVAWAINRRGGLTPRRFLRGSLEDNRERITRIITKAVKQAADSFGG